MGHYLKRYFIGCCVAGLVLAGTGAARLETAHADEFTTLAPNDPLYGDLNAITKAGWLDAASVQSSNHSLTRYEAALETAKAIFAVTARYRADAKWAATAPKPALRSLRALTSSLRLELKKLDVDANETLSLLDNMIKGVSVVTNPAKSGVVLQPDRANNLVRPTTNTVRPHDSHVTINGNSNAVRTLVNPGGNAPVTQRIEIPISQRLRVNTTMQALAREADDPLYNSSLAAGLGNQGVMTGRGMGAAIDITKWLSLNAEAQSHTPLPQVFSLHDALFAGATEVSSMGGGITVRPGRNLTLTGNVEQVNAPGSNIPAATRFGGGVGLTGWQNRFSLSANLSRLVPGELMALSSTEAQLNIGVNVTDHMSLNLLYEQLFGIQNQTQTDRVVAGGLSIHF